MEEMSKMGSVVSRYLKAKRTLDDSISSVLDEAYAFGLQSGRAELRDELVNWLETNKDVDYEKLVEFLGKILEN